MTYIVDVNKIIENVACVFIVAVILIFWYKISR